MQVAKSWQTLLSVMKLMIANLRLICTTSRVLHRLVTPCFVKQARAFRSLPSTVCLVIGVQQVASRSEQRFAALALWEIVMKSDDRSMYCFSVGQSSVAIQDFECNSGCNCEGSKVQVQGLRQASTASVQTRAHSPQNLDEIIKDTIPGKGLDEN